MRVKFLPEAQADLTGIGDYYRELGGNPLAGRMVRQIREAVALLADNPYLAAPYEMVPGLRRLVAADGAFLVFYGVTDQVEVLHVRRAEREPVREGDMV